MNVKEFVTETLVQICEGVQDAAKRLENSGAYISPEHVRTSTDRIVRDDALQTVDDVEFDIAVTATDSTQAGGKAGLSVMGMGFGANAQSDSENSCTSRIRFKVPIALPQAKVPPRRYDEY
jgi:hypothetical protein